MYLIHHGPVLPVPLVCGGPANLEREVWGEGCRKAPAWKGSSSFYNSEGRVGTLSQTALHVSAERREPSSCPFPVDTENASIGMNLDSDVPPS